jgi:hypothetical protein
MCKPPCCNDTGSQGAGIAAVALIMLAALIVAKIGPFVARILHTVVEVIRLVALTTGVVVALAVITWAAIVITCWQLRRRALATVRTRVVTIPAVPFSADQVSNSADCLACGGTGTVLLAIDRGRHQPGACPVCEPFMRAG